MINPPVRPVPRPGFVIYYLQLSLPGIWVGVGGYLNEIHSPPYTSRAALAKTDWAHFLVPVFFGEVKLVIPFGVWVEIVRQVITVSTVKYSGYAFLYAVQNSVGFRLYPVIF
jgi:hypothetical protein